MEYGKTYVPGEGNLGSNIVIVGEAPTIGDTNKLAQFTGTEGRELDRLLKDAGLTRSDCWLTTASKFAVPPNLPRKKLPFHVRARNVGIDIEQQLLELQNEINQLKPNVIIGLGGTALWALTGKDSIKDYRGSILQGMGRKVVCTYNPAGLAYQSDGLEFKGYWNRQIMILDVKRAKKESYTPEINLPYRHLEICQNSAHLLDFYNRYRHCKSVWADIEAGGHCVPICIGLAFNKTHGMTVPLWNVQGISSIPSADLAQCWGIVAQILMEHEVHGQNFNYDRDKILRLGFAIRGIRGDTLLKAFAINPELPKGLAFNTSIYTEEPFYKNEGMYEGQIRDLLLGCARDSCVTCEVDLAMDGDLDELNQRPFYENFLLKLPDLYWEIERNGFRINTQTRDMLLHKYVEWDERLRYELWNLCGQEVNVNSPKQVAVLLFEILKLPRRAGTGEEELTSLLNLKSFTNIEHRKIVELILENRRVRKSIGNYLLALPDFDGRMKTTCFPCLETGRSSNGQQDPPIRPQIEVVDEHGKKKKKSLGTAFQTLTKHGDIGQDIRSQYIPLEDDEVFVQLDSSQAEARVTSLFARDDKMLEMYNKHDIHALTASWFFGGNEAKYSKKVLGYECPERFIGKTLRHAGERGAKGRRAMIEVNTSARKYKVAIKISETDADNALKIFHQKTPNIVNVYFAEVTEVIKQTRRLIAPVPYGVDAPYGGVRTFYERWDDELFRQAFSYLPQRAVSDNTKAAGLRIKPRFPYAKLILESHDALLYSVKVSMLDDFIPIAVEEMERPIDFSNCSLPRRELSIPCEIETGENYMEFKKFKFQRPEIPFTTPVRELTLQERFKVGI